MIGALTVFDASEDEGDEPAYCDGADADLGDLRLVVERVGSVGLGDRDDNWGSPGTSQVDAYLQMAAGTLESWNSGWTSQTAHTFTVSQAAGTPEPLRCLTSTTTATSAWFVGTANNDTTTQGRGSVTLSWPAVPLADSYTIFMWDGVKFDQVATTTSTSWTTSGKNLYPTDTQIAAIAQGYAGNPFTTYGSRDLRDNPNALYQKMAGASAADTDYCFKVVPHNNADNADANVAACSQLRVTLDNRSVVATGDVMKEDARHVPCEFAEWDGHSQGALLDTGAFTAETTDLAIASWGPSAALTRTYTSAATSAGKFAVGWFFGFEQNLAITTNQIVYTDAEHLSHTFARSGSVCTTPNGFLGALTADASGWRLTFFDQSYLSFDSAGKLTAETDDHGNATTYTWTGADMTRVTAANGQYISLTYSSGKLSSASYATADGTRTVRLHDRRALAGDALPWHRPTEAHLHLHELVAHLDRAGGLADHWAERHRDSRLQLEQGQRGALRRLQRDHEARCPRQRGLRLLDAGDREALRHRGRHRQPGHGPRGLRLERLH